MTRQEKIEKAVAAGRELHEQGYNCAESVIGAVRTICPNEVGEDLLRAATALGGGVGGTGDLCGAINAGAMVIGALRGRTSADEPAEARALTGQYMKKMAEETSSFHCQAICRPYKNMAERRANCRRLVEVSIKNALEVALEE